MFGLLPVDSNDDDPAGGLSKLVHLGSRHMSRDSVPESTLPLFNKVRKLIERLSPDAICDDCIADRLALADRESAGHQSRELAGKDGFERRKHICILCGDTSIVIRQIRK